MAEKNDPTEPIHNGENPGDECAKQLEQRQKYENGWFHAQAGRCCFSPCLKWDCAKECKKKRDEADITEERIIKELDIVDFIRNKRISEFVNKVTLKEHQAYFVGKFRKFCTLYEKYDHVLVDDLKKRTKNANDHAYGAVGFHEEDFT